jgi:hypothetical protein
MWKLSNSSGPQLWFSDAAPLDSIRGGHGVSSRLIIDTQGFIDFTELHLPSAIILDLNGNLVQSSIPSTIDLDDGSHPWANITLTIPGDGTFVASASFTGSASTNVASVAGKVKPLPSISASDVAFFDDMIARKHVPFQNIPDAPGKSPEEIKKLGAQFFPFTPYSFQLAMSIYDWTSASFARMVLMKIFQYTGIPQAPLPLDSSSITWAIWKTNVGTYAPSNADFMNSFLMKPTSSEKDLRSQFDLIAPQLHEFSDIENRLLSAAVQALPRTSLSAKRHLFSGQMSIHHLGLDHFGIEFLECPLNKGPVTHPLQINFDSVMSSYVSADKIITTKMVWSFADNTDDAMHYQSGVLLVANWPDDPSWVWETTAYVTPLSDDPEKTEYVFPPGSRFRVLSAERATVQGKKVMIINLQPLPSSSTTQPGSTSLRDELTVASLTVDDIVQKATAYSPILEQQVQLFHEKDVKEKGISMHDAIPLHKTHPNATHFKLAHKTSGRRCACIDALEKILS